MSGPPPLDLDAARRRLRELGYLNGRVDRFVFARAFEGRSGLLLPAVLAGALAAAVACVAATASAEPEFAARAAAPAVLLAHLAVAFLLPSLLFALGAGVIADRSSAPAAGAARTSAAAAALVFAVWIFGARSLATGISVSSLLWGVPVALGAFASARTVRSGFLARAYAHSRTLPATRPRVGAIAAVVAAGLVAAAGILPSRPATPAPPLLHVSPRPVPVLVIAVDGAPEVPGGTDPLGALFATAASGWWPQEAGSPPEIWTTAATGVSAPRHGVRALERVRPLGSPSALRAPLGSRWYLRGIGPALGLVSSAPVSAADRRALAFWEVAALAGLPSEAIGWWASGPWPGCAVTDNRQLLGRASGGEEIDRAALDELRRHPGVPLATIYLPGPDILRADPARRNGEVARLAAELSREADRARAGEIVLIVLSLASHGGAGSIGRIAVFDGGPAVSLRIRAVDVAPSILARSGIPVALDLEGRPVPALFRAGSTESGSVATYGGRVERAVPAPAASDRDYLKKLKALGYLN